MPCSVSTRQVGASHGGLFSAMNAQAELVSGGCAGRSPARRKTLPPYVRGSLAADPVTFPVVDLPLARPVPQRLGVHPQPFGHRGDRGPLGVGVGVPAASTVYMHNLLLLSDVLHRTDDNCHGLARSSAGILR